MKSRHLALAEMYILTEQPIPTDLYYKLAELGIDVPALIASYQTENEAAPQEPKEN